MEFLLLPAEEAAVRRYVEELWLPYNRDLEAVIDAHRLAADIDIVDSEMDFRMDLVESESYQILVALDPAGDVERDQDIAVADGTLVGFIATDIDEAPDVFNRPDRLLIGDFYVQEGYRGEGLAHELMEYAAERAREAGCSELTLNVDVNNKRAIRFYEKLGFETLRNQMIVDTGELSWQIQ
jgi:ribosomal protein S18 acetylase RimI-like enzyme